jgi:hypothetical protein
MLDDYLVEIDESDQQRVRSCRPRPRGRQRRAARSAPSPPLRPALFDLLRSLTTVQPLDIGQQDIDA